MRKIITIAALTLAGLGATAGVALADDGSSDQTVIVNQSNSQSAGSSDCAPASVAALVPWLHIPVCE